LTISGFPYDPLYKFHHGAVPHGKNHCGLGNKANIGIFELHDGNFEFMDGSGEKLVGRKKLVNKAVVCRGKLFVNEV